MVKFILTAIVMLFAVTIFAQDSVIIDIKDKEDSSPVTSATARISKLNKSLIADSSGRIVLENLPHGTYLIQISSIGYAERKIGFEIPANSTPIIVLLEKEEDMEQEVVVTATRLSRTIANVPTRVEVISGEELDE